MPRRRMMLEKTKGLRVGPGAGVPLPAEVFRDDLSKIPAAALWSSMSGNHNRPKNPHARSAAMIPVRNIPSNVPAPPMLAIGAPSSAIWLRLRRSAPIKVPSVPLT